jgi:hypothetical protein
MFYDKSELAKGIKHEKEHTDDEALATKIAIDHLMEDPHYYTKLEKSGLEECGDDSQGSADSGIIAPVAPSVAVFKIDAPSLAAMVTGDDQQKLSSSGLGDSGAPKPLTTTKLTAPPEKNQVGPNKVVVGNTPPITTQADALNHFGSQMLEKW